MLVVVSRGCRIRCNGTRGLSGRVMIWVAVPHPFFLEETEARHEGVAIGTGPQKVQSPNPERPNEWVGKGGGGGTECTAGFGQGRGGAECGKSSAYPLLPEVRRVSAVHTGPELSHSYEGQAESRKLVPDS